MIHHTLSLSLLFRTLLPCIALLVLGGCEQTIENPQLPYEEKLVVWGYIFNDSNNVAITVTRTLPLTEKFSIQKAAIPNAVVRLTTPEGEVAMKYDTVRHQYMAYNITPRIGAQYSLRVEWAGKVATATTLLPQPPEVLSVSYARSQENDIWGIQYKTTFHLKVRNQANACFGAVDWLFWKGQDTSKWSFFDRWSPYVDTYFDKQVQDTVQIERQVIETNGHPVGTHFARVFAFDAAYYHYQQSRNNSDDDPVFGSAGTNPLFNVRGDAIGNFIGVSRAKDIQRTSVQ